MTDLRTRPGDDGAATADVDPGSFRDPDSRVLHDGTRVLRALSEDGAREWAAVVDSGLAAELIDEGKLIATSEVADAPAVDLPFAPAAVLEHERIPFVSYPYEWSFEMLRDAARLHLEILARAIERGLMLKDATPYNVQWRGARPVFVDAGSFEPLRDGEAWAAYRQFCTLFLYPLMLSSFRGVPFQPWLRGSIDGISPAECRRVLSRRDLLRRGVTTHVVLHEKLERRNAETTSDVRGELRGAGFKRELILANVRGLDRLIRKLDRPTGESEWSGYTATTSYSEDDAERKEAFVRRAASDHPAELAWDLGCNEGRHARIAAETSGSVVAVDGDATVIDRLYRSLAADGPANVLPLVADLVDPSPALGWNLRERASLAERGRPGLTLCLAVVHHLSITGGVPVAQVLDWLCELGGVLVIEFPTREDPMVARLLARKRAKDHPDYDRGWFERCLEERFEIERTEEMAGGRRILYCARPRR